MNVSSTISKTAAVVLLAFAAGVAQAAVVYANNPAPGDSFTNAGGTNTGQAVGTSNWYYNNVRNSGEVGINDTYARSGNGSAYMETVFGPGGASSKADIEYLLNATANANGNYSPGAVLGLFSDFTAMSYDWYRDSASTNSNVQAPALRVLLFAPVLSGVVGLVFEPTYNGGGVAPTDTWVSQSIGASTKLWSFGAIGFEFDINGDSSPYDPLSDWQASAQLAGASVIGFSAGVGSGWGPFKGAVDNIGWTIGNQSQTFNFEVERQATVPEPATMALLGGGLLALLGARRRRKSS